MSDKKIWDFWAGHYQNLWVQNLSLEPTRIEIINQLKNQIKDKDKQYNILDIGCGTGQLVRDIQTDFKEYKISITAVDYSEQMIKQAKKNQKRYQLQKFKNPKNLSDTKYIKMDANDINKIDEKFDIIICTHSLPYYENQRDIIIKMIELLKSEGLLYLAQASENTMYDLAIMKAVKLTTGKALYPSVRRLTYMTADVADMVKTKKISVKPFMPSLYMFVLKNKQ